MIAMFFAKYAPEIEVAAGALFVSAVSAMPKAFPKSAQEWWTWLRETLQSAIPARRHVEPDPPPNPYQPAEPAQPK
ncbi:hypothetical protein ACFPT7_02240 [Acidicapsa dinghuensis]|uniref:Uncharacterized protein n=1 Tax=Acidicapsa dinghuensis TaxID=2218256 RepID=A0ABW1EA37_9BACT|nr:hypothetical protein [Acidicapsa dinghuensis]